ncbi:MAG: (Fe-S)-binding protein [Candidatus Thorarchaeota archaeon]
MSSIWTKARKNTPKIDCGLCGFPTCATFARSLVTNETDLSRCPILSLDAFGNNQNELAELLADVPITAKPAPERPEDGVLMSKPCMDAPELQMAEMRIFNGVDPGSPQRFGVLDPVILCWLLDCVSSKYQDMKCSVDLAYAWGDMEETKIHILRDGKVRMRRARGKEHALESFRIIERTVIGATICNCCGHDLFSVLAGLAPAKKAHTILKAGSSLVIDPGQINWTLSSNAIETALEKKMFNLIEPIHTSLTNQLDLMITGDFDTESKFDARPEICKYISMMLEPESQTYVTMFLKGLANEFFMDGGLRGLREIRLLVQEQPKYSDFVVDLLSNVRTKNMSGYDIDSLDQPSTLLLAHALRVSRALDLYDRWK